MSDTETPKTGSETHKAEPADEATDHHHHHEARNARLLRWLIQATSLVALKGEAAAMARAARTRAILKTIEIVFWIVVIGFAFGAFVTWLASVVGPLWACAIIAGVAAVVALILHLIGAYMSRHRPTIHLQSAFPALAQASREGLLDDAALGALALAALAGIFLGTRSKPR